MPVNLRLYYYHAHPGNCSGDENQPSGAYIFRPNTSDVYNWTQGSGGIIKVKIISIKYENHVTKILMELVMLKWVENCPCFGPMIDMVQIFM